jgi:glycosyltransferase involved in cell wall biosynthesis
MIKIILGSKNSGITVNCNNAWRACSGDWIKTIAGDDKLKPDCLIKFINDVVSDGGEYDAYFSRMENFDENGNLNEVLLNEFFFSLSEDDRLKYTLYKNPLPAPTCFIKRVVLEEIGFASENYVMLEDYPLWFNLLRAKKKIKAVDASTVLYRVGFGVSNGIERICNISYVRSLHAFRVEKLWPHLGFWSFFKKLDDITYFYQQSIGYQYFENKKSWLYSLLVLLTAPFRLFSLLLLSKRFFALVIRTTSLR